MIKKKYIIAIIFIVIILAIGFLINSQEEQSQEPKTNLTEIIGEDYFIRDVAYLDVDKNSKEEIAVLFVKDKEILKDESIWCGNVSGEKLKGIFYLGLVKDGKIIHRIELLAEYFENGGDFSGKKLVIPQDLNGDGNKAQFVFTTYSRCNGDYVEVINYNFLDNRLERVEFYRDEEIFEELFISYVELPGLEYKDGYLIEEYYSVGEPYGLFNNYYSWSEEKRGFDFVKTIQKDFEE